MKIKPSVRGFGWILLVSVLMPNLSGNAQTTPGGMFPKMPAASKAFVVDSRKTKGGSEKIMWALQGLVNQSSAEVYVINNNRHIEQLEYSKKPFETLNLLEGENAQLRTLFQKYQGHVKKMFIYDPAKDWTWYLALMAGAQQDGIPVTEDIGKALTAEFNWSGEFEDFRNRWGKRLQAYDWALTNLMPNCSKQVVFALGQDMPLTDYAVATKGFAFWLDFKTERSQVEKIFRTKGYGVGTSLMGYANTGDDANLVANPFGIGYVVGNRYCNGSFWSSFANRTYKQAPGRAVTAQPGKIYAHIMWSDGDNLHFDQRPIYNFWHDSARGQIPVATALSPTLQELNSPLLEWYYSNMTDKDELMAGPTGVQFVFIQNFRSDLFPAWCKLNQLWCASAGFRTARIWLAPNPSVKYSTYMKSCGFDGLIGEGWSVQPGFPPKMDTHGAANEEELFKRLESIAPNPRAPVFCGFTCISQGFNDSGYSGIKRQVDRIEKLHPGRYVFLLPKDQFATIREYYHLPKTR